MRFYIRRASILSDTEKPTEEAVKLESEKDIYKTWQVEINTLEELLEFCPIVIKDEGDEYSHIIIYDDYIE